MSKPKTLGYDLGSRNSNRLLNSYRSEIIHQSLEFAVADNFADHHHRVIQLKQCWLKLHSAIFNVWTLLKFRYRLLQQAIYQTYKCYVLFTSTTRDEYLHSITEIIFWGCGCNLSRQQCDQIWRNFASLAQF